MTTVELLRFQVQSSASGRCTAAAGVRLGLSIGFVPSSTAGTELAPRLLGSELTSTTWR
jgi:hypothetical protein